jgi:hypothetical protein
LPDDQTTRLTGKRIAGFTRVMHEVKAMLRSERPLLRIFAAATVVLFAIVAISAASPEIHHTLHADASQPGHHCALTMLSEGHVEAGVPTVFVCISLQLSFDHPVVEAPFCSVTDCVLPAGRAPPPLF